MHAPAARARQYPGYRRLAAPGLGAALLLVALGAYAEFRSMADIGLALPVDDVHVLAALITAAGLAVTWLASRLVELALMRAMARKGRRPSRLLLQTVAAVMFLAFLIAALPFVFDASLIGALPTSGVLVAVLGFALRAIIGSATGLKRRPGSSAVWSRSIGARPA